MESLNSLIYTMQSMVNLHSQLLETAKVKRAALVEGTLQELQNVTLRENSLVEEIQNLEQQRKQFVYDYMAKKGFSGQSFTLEELLKFPNDAARKDELKMIAKQLRILIQEITHINDSNQQLLQTSLSYVQFSIGMHVRKEPSIGYGPNSKNRYVNLLDAKI